MEIHSAKRKKRIDLQYVLGRKFQQANVWAAGKQDFELCADGFINDEVAFVR